jgi:endonuclease/exonuclease/phosphatase (EEP) superfamily protein YafD
MDYKRILAWVLVFPGAVWGLARITGWDSWPPMVQLIAFTPYVAALSVAPMVVTVLWRQRAAAAVALVTLLALIIAVLPRATGDRDPLAGAQGPELKVLTVNLLKGQADVQSFLVLAGQADVVAVQELTPAFAERMRGEFAYEVTYPAAGVGGSGLYSRLPLGFSEVRFSPFEFAQVSAELTGLGVSIESVHPVAPAQLGWTAAWRESYRRQRPAAPDGPMWILAGDFNATLDHSSLRALLGTGYRDAADVLGSGLTGTWGPYDGDWIPAVTLDRVLADRRLGIRSVTVHQLPGADHRAILATLVLP